MESAQKKVWHMGLFSRYLVLLLLLWLFCYWSEPFPQRNKGESCSLSVPGAGLWGGGPCNAGAGEQPREGSKHTVFHTLAAGGALPGIAEMTVGLRVLCLLSFAQCGPLNWSLRGAILHQAGRIFCKTDDIHM